MCFLIRCVEHGNPIYRQPPFCSSHARRGSLLSVSRRRGPFSEIKFYSFTPPFALVACGLPPRSPSRLLSISNKKSPILFFAREICDRIISLRVCPSVARDIRPPPPLGLDNAARSRRTTFVYFHYFSSLLFLFFQLDTAWRSVPRSHEIAADSRWYFAN